jgi:hypothetical protein
MAAIAVVALNLTLWRVVSAYDTWLPIGVGPAWIICQGGLLSLGRAHGRQRAFWSGFVVAGVVAFLSYLSAMEAAKSGGMYLDETTGQLFRSSCEYGVPDSLRHSVQWSPFSSFCDWSMHLWVGYIELTFDFFWRLSFTANVLRRKDMVRVVLGASIAFFPQFISALGGGLMAFCIALGLGSGGGRGQRKVVVRPSFKSFFQREGR